MTKTDAQMLVDMSNRSVNTYHDSFTRGREEFTFAEWAKYNQGLEPYIISASHLVHMLHAEGFTEYKVNMQSGLIS
jgi:hypothetical protein